MTQDQAKNIVDALFTAVEKKEASHPWVVKILEIIKPSAESDIVLAAIVMEANSIGL